MVWTYMGPRDDAAAAARPRGQHAAREPALRACRRCASATGCRRWRATSTPVTSRLPALRCSTRSDFAYQDFEFRHVTSAPAFKVADDRLRRDLRRPSDDRRPAPLAHRAVPVPVLHASSRRTTRPGSTSARWVPIDDDNTQFWAIVVEPGPADGRAALLHKGRRRTDPRLRTRPYRPDGRTAARALAAGRRRGQRLPHRLPGAARPRGSPASRRSTSRTRR